MAELLTLDDVARELRVSVHTVRDWRKKGILPVLKLPSGTIRVRRDDIDRMLTMAAAT